MRVRRGRRRNREGTPGHALTIAIDQRRAISGLSLALLAAALLTGCSEEDPGDPTNPGGQPTNNSPATSAAAPLESADSGEPPSVSDPLDVSRLEQDPCTAMSSSQVSQLNLEPGEKESSSGGAPICAYKYNDGSGSQVSVILAPEFANGLDDVYQRRSELGYFEETEVSGYPAVYASPDDDRATGTCQLHVGLNDEFIVSVMAQLLESSSDYPKGCEVAELTTQTMIENLKGGA